METCIILHLSYVKVWTKFGNMTIAHRRGGLCSVCVNPLSLFKGKVGEKRVMHGSGRWLLQECNRSNSSACYLHCPSVKNFFFQQLVFRLWWTSLHPDVTAVRRDTLDFFLSHTLSLLHPSILPLSCLFTCPLMGCGLQLCTYTPIHKQALVTVFSSLTPLFFFHRICTLWLLITEKVAGRNHNRYKLLRGGVFKGADASLWREKKRAGEKCF